MSTMREALRDARRRGFDENRVTLCGTVNNTVDFSIKECSFELRCVTSSVLFIPISLPAEMRQKLYGVDIGMRVRIIGELVWAKKPNGSGRLLVKGTSLDIL